MSFVVPVLNEAPVLPDLLDDLAVLTVDRDVTVVDGGSADGTVDAARARGARVLVAGQGRANQMNAGAAAVRGAFLCFLHADVRVPDDAGRDLERVVTEGHTDAAVWRLAVAHRRFVYRVVELGAGVRHVVAGLPYGDQGLIVRRSVFEEMGGFAPVPVMEDVDLIRRLKRRTRVVRLRSAVRVSARRWERDGVLRRTLHNSVLIAAFHLGVPPARLAKWYPAGP